MGTAKQTCVVWLLTLLLTIQSVYAYGSNYRACPAYEHFAKVSHRPYSTGPLQLPYQRPAAVCRTFESPLVEKIIHFFNENLVDKDLARLFENAFPNTLDTTVKWHTNGKDNTILRPAGAGADIVLGDYDDDGAWAGPQSFIVTGDINAEWLRDSTNQLTQYQRLASKDARIRDLILGAINTQAEFVIESPYCNAFQPPPPSGMGSSNNNQMEKVHPAYEPSQVFECKYELDSLAHFLSLGNRFYNNTGSTAWLTPRWYAALVTLLDVVREQSKSTFDAETGEFVRNEYTFQRQTTVGTETLSLGGIGNPLAAGTGLVRSAFRPSDDATIFGFFIPANAMMAVELNRTAEILQKTGKKDRAKHMKRISADITRGIWEHGVVEHKKWGRVFAYEVDGYGSSLLMDDANLPSLLALPLLGFVDTDHEVYRNTRRMILSQEGNPYYLTGSALNGVGGPHVGLEHAWPLSLLVQAMTTDDDKKIISLLTQVKGVSQLGLVHESVHVENPRDFTRSWFAWANSVFAQTVLDLAERKPTLLFGPKGKPFVVEDFSAADEVE